ncbi:MAG: methyltransferase domain-containing protein [Candidatus Krumholzibacteria bacterium]|nr:methyltransferase domain-containing protein [Candidatus Krumholzibacteria bacterium]MDH4335856.1 methyltransferase domain-containing protein [Candidatus Krumholzibacteria bacterium]MDH5270348.1 methyltransferase domain-containing protein [Candidatus Krumholzibacteria bacterium]MDH5627118.1 methyltransferase domain-containing protein [Candidatus Krumholzibacteria bacterium]
MPTSPETLVHETTYRKRNPVGWVHRNRLRAVAAAFDRYLTQSVTSWLDAGCSNGFIVEAMVAHRLAQFQRIAGFDNTPGLIERARAKGIPNAAFAVFDLNTVQPATERFALVTCLETLEHVGNIENAIANLVDRVEAGGLLLLSVPNETGLPGLVKLAGRAAVRRNPYDDFFADGGRARYVSRLLLNRRIDGFRKSGRGGYGPHLGFDYRTMEDHLRDTYVTKGVLERRAREITTLGMNVLLVYRKAR